VEEIKQAQHKDKDLMKIRELEKIKLQTLEWMIKEYCGIKTGFVCPRRENFKEGKFQELILDEAHNSAYSIHPGATKMYMDLKERYW